MPINEVALLTKDFWSMLFEILSLYAELANNGTRVVQTPPGRDSDEIMVLNCIGKTIAVFTLRHQSVKYATRNANGFIEFGKFDPDLKRIAKEVFGMKA